MSELEPYEPLNKSCLVDWKIKIEEMRSLNWPYWKIAEWLLSEKKLTVHKDTIRKFCIRQNITKGPWQPTTALPRKSASSAIKQSVQPGSQERKFEFLPEDEKPIHIH